MYQLKTKFYSQHKDTTQVTIINEAPYRYIEEELQGDLTNADEQEVIQLVLDKLVAEVAPAHAINRLDEKTTELDTKLAEVDDFISGAKATMEEIKKQSAITQGALIEMIEMMGLGMASPDLPSNEVAPAEEKTNEEPKEDSTGTEEPLEGGEVNDGDATSN